MVLNEALEEHQTSYRRADKSLARTGRKRATATKF